MTRRFGLVPALVLCACRPPPSDGVTLPAAGNADASSARLRLFEETGLPNMLGWARVEQVVAVDSRGTPRCRRAWVQQQGAHRVLFADEIDVDYGGFWFARWPLQMRRPTNAYVHVDLPVRQASTRRVFREEALAEQPSDLLAESTTSLRGANGCSDHGNESASVTLARAGWVRALGHERLARAMIARWPIRWSESYVRRELSLALTRLAHESLRQGMPRIHVRPVLERAAAICNRGPGEYATAQLALLGEDPSLPLDASDPESLLVWLADDLVFPRTTYLASRPRDVLGWPTDQAPRSPGLELVAQGWSVLPALLEREWPDQLMRTSTEIAQSDGVVPLRTTARARRDIASSIALCRFADDEAMREWWRMAKPIGEVEALLATLGRRDGWAPLRVRRLLALDRGGALERIDGALLLLDVGAREAVVASIVEESWPPDDPPAAAVGEAALERLLTRSVRSTSLIEAAWAAEGLRRLGNRDWIAAATVKARAVLEAGTSQDDRGGLVRLLVTVARADARRGATLLRVAERSKPDDEPFGIAEEVSDELCESFEGEPTPDCRGPLRQMFDARARANRRRSTW